jgi:hypothetical protein
VGVAALFFRIASDVAVPRFYLLAIWSLAEGCFLAWLTADLGLGIALFYVLLGPAILVLGGVTLLRYLRSAPLEAGND